MSAGMTLFLELNFEPLVLSIVLFLIGLLFAFSGVWLINSLQPEDGEGGAKVNETVQDGNAGLGGKLTISETAANDDVEMALGSVPAATSSTPNKAVAWAEDTRVLTSEEEETGEGEKDGGGGGRAGGEHKLEYGRPQLPGVVCVEEAEREEVGAGSEADWNRTPSAA